MAIAAKVDPGEWGKIFTRMPPEKRKGVSIERLHKILEILVKDQKGK